MTGTVLEEREDYMLKGHAQTIPNSAGLMLAARAR
jgi:hypothetical protein